MSREKEDTHGNWSRWKSGADAQPQTPAPPFSFQTQEEQFDPDFWLRLIDPSLYSSIDMSDTLSRQSYMSAELQSRCAGSSFVQPHMNNCLESAPPNPNPTPPQPALLQPSRESPASSSAEPSARDLERKFRCLDCGNGFKTSSALRHHSYTHSKERPFLCNFENCSKNYTTNNRLYIQSTEDILASMLSRV
ncbi:hypothetical protein BJ741DRAFT_665318 [Chytriomyces cf. hyalinus JEL632]|nr:hypothetical protein BJ741DRAFT_665318 [Chytriomyces cf. hyalinus JEL632]